MWGGWGSNPRPADYEKPSPAQLMHYLHGYHGVVPPIALIAPFARVARSTNRSTPRQGDHPESSYRTLPPTGLDMPGLSRRVSDTRIEASP